MIVISSSLFLHTFTGGVFTLIFFCHSIKMKFFEAVASSESEERTMISPLQLKNNDIAGIIKRRKTIWTLFVANFVLTLSKICHENRLQICIEVICKTIFVIKKAWVIR